MATDAAQPLPRFLDGGGEMGAMLRAFDWTAHPFGPPGNWPEALRQAVSICLHSSFPTAVYWGPDLRIIYNDARAALAGDRHPHALGRPAAEVWHDIWDVVGPQFHAVLATGEGFSTPEQLLTIERDGERVESYWSYSFSPVRDSEGNVRGLLNQGTETTDRTRAEMQLRAREERLEMALDASGNIGTWDWDVRADRLIGDGRIARLYGVEPDMAAAGAPAASFLRNMHPDDYERFTATMRSAFAEAGSVSTEYRLLLPDGSLRWLAAQGRCWCGTDGRPDRFTGVTLDISIVKQAELALRRATEQREFVQTLAERQRAQADPDDVMQITAEAIGRYLGVNRAGFFRVIDDQQIEYGACWTDGTLAPLTGRVAAETFGGDVRPLIRSGATLVFGGPDTPGGPAEEALAATDTRAGIGVPLIRGGQWEAGFYLSHATPRAWTPDEVALVEEVAQLSWDAVARVGALARLRLANSSLQGQVTDRDRIWHVSQDMLGIADADSVWISVNPAWTRLLGWEEEEIVGRTAEWLTHPDDVERARQERTDRRTLGGNSLNFELRLRTRGGDYRTLSWTTVTTDGRIYATAQDVTDQRELEDRLRQAQKMEAVGQLTGGIAHDFNNLLTGISGAMEMMQVRLKQGRVADVDRYIGVAQAAAGRAAALTHRLLAFSRRQTLDPRPTDVNRLIVDMEELIRRTVGPQVRLEVVGTVGLWPTLIDPNQLENALLNLCINARDAMPDGGRLTIETANKWLDDRAAQERDLVPGQYLSLCVTDTGTGMTADVIDRAFDPFFTTKPMGQGTGLGLSMIYGFARQSGGQVRIYSELGQGTTLCLYLPRHHGPADELAPSTGVEHGKRVASGMTVLVVDDEPTIRMLVTEILDDMGYTAIEAADGTGALAILKSDARIDLLITDIGLPGGMNGRQVADAARAARPKLPILFITGYAENAVIGNEPLEPGMELVTKPFSMNVIEARIRAMVG